MLWRCMLTDCTPDAIFWLIGKPSVPGRHSLLCFEGGVSVGPQDTILTFRNHPAQQEITLRNIASHDHGTLAEQEAYLLMMTSVQGTSWSYNQKKTCIWSSEFRLFACLLFLPPP